MLEAFKKIPFLYRAIIVGVLSILLVMAIVAGYRKLSTSYDVYRDNKADAEMQKKVDALQAQIKANDEKIQSLEVDKINLKADNAQKDKELVLIREAIANDGKVIASEQKKIDEAHRKYENEKDSCTANSDPDAYVWCVCAKLGVPCDS